MLCSDDRNAILTNLQQRLPADQAEYWVNLYAAMARFRHSTKTKERMQVRKLRGLRCCRYAGYGFYWQFDPRIGDWVRVPDRHEQFLAHWILVAHDRGHSFGQIARFMLNQRIKTSAGREWSVDRVRRVYNWAAKWRACWASAQKPEVDGK